MLILKKAACYLCPQAMLKASRGTSIQEGLRASANSVSPEPAAQPGHCRSGVPDTAGWYPVHCQHRHPPSTWQLHGQWAQQLCIGTSNDTDRCPKTNTLKRCLTLVAVTHFCTEDQTSLMPTVWRFASGVELKHPDRSGKCVSDTPRMVSNYSCMSIVCLMTVRQTRCMQVWILLYLQRFALD